jgi:hypothetical protein
MVESWFVTSKGEGSSPFSPAFEISALLRLEDCYWCWYIGDGW